MPRPKQPGAPEPKRRSRNGCCCSKTGEVCDYSIRLIWEGRRVRRPVPSTGDAETSPAPDDNTRKHGSSTVEEQLWSPSPLSSAPTSRRAPTSQPFEVEDADRSRRQPESLSFPNAFDSAACVNQPGPSFPVPYDARAATSPSGLGFPDEQYEDKAGGTGSFPEDFQGGQFTSISTEGSLWRSYTHSPPLTRTTAPLPTRGSITKPSRRRHRKTKSGFGSLGFDDANPRPRTQGEPSPALTTMPASLRPHLMSLVSSPMTPGAASSHSDDVLYASSWTHNQRYDSPGPWYSGDSDLADSPVPMASPWDVPSAYSHAGHQAAFGGSSWESGKFYGYDLGKKDEDIVKNDDANAIFRVNYGMRDPSQATVEDENTIWRSYPDARISGVDAEVCNSGIHGQMTAVVIPWNLEPLPDKLQDNPMDLLSNPFRTILAKMAIENDQLLSLVLAYSASHRARLLQTTEPAMRMAQWVEEIFPALRKAVSNTEDAVSNANMATAIMLASLEIISPKAFGYAIPWQQHLQLAREMICRRLTDLRHGANKPEEDRDCWFLWSWFAYLDVLGSFTSMTKEMSSPVTWLQDFIYEVVEDMDEMDCIIGCTIRCVSLLAQTAELAGQCDLERIGADRRVWPDWVPSSGVLQQARKLEADLHQSLEMPFRPCRHMQDGRAQDVEAAEMMATNRSLHWGGLLQLQRRVFGKASDHDDVRGPVREILRGLGDIRPGGAAETGFLFPMFTAGCEVVNEGERAVLLARFKSIETRGMVQVRAPHLSKPYFRVDACRALTHDLLQVHRARTLMEKSWQQGRPWETLVDNEFIG
ncbi:hypothetical protein S7711_11379 [Stachybotrys chartarum IBT 7711]|uniref:Transcription factor domain-containing protein n=1 Tax=Stachybotrys chartarum (strain CBS 109288 / IBT 7711) TaxID=1280523 RepID=A0A084AJV5_STACB|nr:hypothetical protein S7711_11379 [Stachybotrys chartarum IBT 7711]